MKQLFDTTIAAISTPYGRGGIAVIRLSGPDAIAIASKVFAPKSGRPLADCQPAKLQHGDIFHEGEIIDDGMAVIFRAPHSFTGEDSAELHCHGGIVLSQTVLEAVLAAGAVPAGPGEFTKRAFLSGKMDLSQAEAVIELIDADSREKLKLSAAQARGVLSRRIGDLYNRIKALLASVYVYIDFPDEDLSDVSAEEMIAQLSALAADMDQLIATYHTGRAVMNGIATAIVGKPNTGKSSFLNALLGEQRALVTDIAGTTRDTVEETVNLGKLTLRLCDTAGIRSLDIQSDSDRIEALGIDRSVQKLKEAELIFAVFDTARPLDEQDEQVLSFLAESTAPIIALLNKSDLSAVMTEADIARIAAISIAILPLSAKSGEGLSSLTAAVEKLFLQGELDLTHDAIVTNARQYVSLKAARERVADALSALTSGLPQDLAGLDLEQALTHLSELDGREVTEDIVSDIFHRFCVGK